MRDSRRLVECVPNFSEGRDQGVVESIVEAVASSPGAHVLGWTMDADHNRSVVTFVGDPEAVYAAALRAVRVAVERIDLNQHVGVHPRVGAADVLPFVPVRGVTMQDCVALANRAAEEIWSTLGVPVYLYEAAARRPERVRLEDVRRGGFERIREAVLNDLMRRPDIGGPELHRSAGACVVGARPFLVAMNVNLETEDVSVADRIAKEIRASSGGFPHVKALGLALKSRGQVQVSMNLTDFRRTPVHVVVDKIRRRAEELGVGVAGTEVIGLLPRGVIEGAAAYYLGFERFESGMVLENRVEEILSGGEAG